MPSIKAAVRISSPCLLESANTLLKVYLNRFSFQFYLSARLRQNEYRAGEWPDGRAGVHRTGRLETKSWLPLSPDKWRVKILETERTQVHEDYGIITAT